MDSWVVSGHPRKVADVAERGMKVRRHIRGGDETGET
jgi:hypothetical protein